MAPRVQIVSAAFAAAGFLRCIDAHPCDPEHETHCPTSGPDALGSCLSKVPATDISDSCKDWYNDMQNENRVVTVALVT